MIRKTARIALVFSFLFVAVGAWAGAACATQVTDSAGRVITFDKPFTRIISLYSAHTENLAAMGGQGALIGASKSEGGAVLPRFSYHDGTERFLAARPDLVLIRPMIDRGYGRLVASLEARGITVVSLQPATVDGMMDYWVSLGLLSGREAEARAMVKTFKIETLRIKSLTQGVADRPTVFFEAMHGKLRTFSKGSMGAWALDIAGGLNVAEDAVASKGSNVAIYGKERLLAKGSQIDVYLSQRGRMNHVSQETIENEPGFSLIRAVREGEIYFVDEALVSRPTPALLDGVRTIGAILYPSLFTATTKGRMDHGQPLAP